MKLVRFVADDRGGLWNKGDLADEQGPESPDVPELIMLNLLPHGGVITLIDPYGRGIIEPVADHRHTHTVRDGKTVCVYCGEELEL